MLVWEMKITIASLYDFDNTIFDNLNLPVATQTLPAADKETAVYEILENCNDFEVMYPDSDYMKESIGYWSNAMQITWNRIWRAIHEEYNPLYNFDRNEDTHIEKSGDSFDKHETIHEETSGDNTQTINTNETGAKTAFNSSAFQNTDKTTNSGTVGNEGEGERDVTTHNYGSEGEGEIDSTRHLYGNIGVTTSQQMLEAEINVAKELDFYKMVSRQFAEKFCILVY